jgi:glucose-1-phosphate cytidylyltransferase
MDPRVLPKVLILCGGRGTRLQTGSKPLPKPLVEIGGMPVVWHVVQLYAGQGFSDFVLLTGHRGHEVADFAASADWPESINVQCLDTGEDTPTGGRVQRAVNAFDPQPMCVTYADGVSNVDLREVAAELDEPGVECVVTVVRPELPFGVARLEGDRVIGFEEKPQSQDWINGGFMALSPEALATIGEAEILERGPLERLAESGKLKAHKHDGFWFCMDTYKDQVALNDLWEDGHAPWRNWT